MSEEVFTENPAPRRDKWTYKCYTCAMSAKQARFVLFGLLSIVLMAELALRISPPRYLRASQNGMFGIREQLIDLQETKKPKIVGVGDSTLVGAGVFDYSKTVMGLVRKEFGERAYVADLAIPGGTSATSLMVLNSLKRRGVSGIRDVIIEVLPSKFLATAGGSETLRHDLPNSAPELQRYDPFTVGDGIGSLLSMQDRVESYLEYQLAASSVIYRNKDLLRDKFVGANPAFYVAGRLAPPAVLKRVFGDKKGGGNNRLAAQVEDRTFDQADRQPSDVVWRFTREGEGGFFEEAVDAAKALRPQRVIVVEVPFHYEFLLSSPRDRESLRVALARLDEYLVTICKAKGASFVSAPSSEFQADYLWTRVVAHFKEPVHAEIFRRLEPFLRNPQ